MKDITNIILDTDMGPDCDDAGALGLLHILLTKRTDYRLKAVTHCTSSPYGCGCIDAINRAYGHTDIPVGQWEDEDFLMQPEYFKYDKYISEHLENIYPADKPQPSALEVAVDALKDCADGSVVYLAIGPLNNLSRLLDDEEGYALVSRKVRLLVSMSGGFREPEWNVLMDIPAADNVYRRWPSPIILSPFETGAPIITGANFGDMPQNHPVRVAYCLHSPEGRMSWDLTAAWAAVEGTEPFFELSECGEIVADEDGNLTFTSCENGRFRYLKNKMQPEAIGKEIDSMWG